MTTDSLTPPLEAGLGGARRSILVGFLGLGLFMGMWGALVPARSADLGLSELMIGGFLLERLREQADDPRFEKAFVSVEHAALWKVFEKQSIPRHYVDLLKRLYSGQDAFVQAGTRSRFLFRLTVA